MKNRNIPFGYQYSDAVITVHPQEMVVVKEICQEYLSGKSLLEICTQLNLRQIEYLPGITGWNKARLMRIIEDERYIGKENYPAILDSADFYEMQSKKQARRTHRPKQERSRIYDLKAPILCPVCGSPMHRRYDSRCKCQHRWTCCNEQCKKLVECNGDDLLESIRLLVSGVTANPQIIRESPQNMGVNTECRRLENEIQLELGSSRIDRDVLRIKMIHQASLKYLYLDPKMFAARKLRMDIVNAKWEDCQTVEFYNRAISTVQFLQDGCISITLINDQIIRKEDFDGYRISEESGKSDPCIDSRC